MEIHDASFVTRASLAFHPDSGSSLRLYNSGDILLINLDGAIGVITIRDSAGSDSIILNGNNHTVVLPGKAGKNSITLDGNNGDIKLYDKDGKHSFSIHGNVDTGYTGVWIGAKVSEDGFNKPGKIFLRDGNGTDSITLDGQAGDIFLGNADCAEDFDIAESAVIEPGTVMVIDQEGKLQQSSKAYDKTVAGVISGAGDYKPGLVLDKKQSQHIRKSISLMGKVYCKVDANDSSIEVGDLLTTSATPGHAMNAADPLKAFGAVIGKALRPLKAGKGLIPILIALQ